MAPIEEMHTAMINRSIRTIKAELEYLCDASVITPQSLNELLSRIPPQTALHAPISVGAVPSAVLGSSNLPTPQMSNLNLNNNNNQNQNPTQNRTTSSSEKSDHTYFQPSPSPQPPPTYNAPPPQANWPPLAEATALYAYTSNDAGDLELQPNDHITVTEYMNAEWWKGRSSRTGQEGIFPRSYVRVTNEKGFNGGSTVGTPNQMVNNNPNTNNNDNNYGNAPLQVSGMGNGEGHVPGKAEQQAKKFGKKLGNAAIFGAGATLGADLVNSIF